MKLFKIIVYLLGSYLLCTACRHDKKFAIDNSIAASRVDDSIVKFVMKKFSLPYPEDLKLDSNSLIFYCFRSYDTSTLVHLQKKGVEIYGVFYEILPTYHRYPKDFADQKSNLLFFEGYSFIIDPAIWKAIQEQAQIVLDAKDSLNENHHYTDESTYSLYYNMQSSHGRSSNGIRYEKFDKFLKGSFLEKFMKARKPIMHKTK